MVLVGLILAAVAGAHGTDGATTYGAVILVVLGIIVLILGRVRKGGRI